jgi:threonylcarbamoyladenosine tRNA methylthiotransferase MtaB
MQGQVKEEIKKARSERLLALNDQDVRRFRQQFLGETVQVLLESYKHGRWEGLTDNYLRVEVDGLANSADHDWQNTFVSARLTQLVDDGVLGVAVE